MSSPQSGSAEDATTLIARRVQKRMTGFGGEPPSLDRIKAILYAAEREHLDHHARVLAERDRYRTALERAGRALNRAGWIEESQAVLDVLRGES